MVADQANYREIGPQSTPMDILMAVTTASVRQLAQYEALLPESFFQPGQLEQFHKAEQLGLHPGIHFGLAKPLVTHFHAGDAWDQLVAPIVDGMQKMSLLDVLEQMHSSSGGQFSEAQLMEMAIGLMKPGIRERAAKMLEVTE